MTKQEDKDDLAATKALERKARLTQMMISHADHDETPEQANHSKPATNTSRTTTTPVSAPVPAALANLESKLDKTKPHPLVALANVESKLDAKLKARRDHVSRMISDDPSRVNAVEAPGVEDDPETRTFAEAEDTHNYHNPEIRAEIVDDRREYEQITMEAHQMIMARSVQATSVEKANEQKTRNTDIYACVGLAILLLIGAILAGVCGSGYCSVIDEDSEDSRIQAVVELINAHVTEPIEYPIIDSSDPKQQALLFVTENDLLKLNAKHDSARIVQRFGLANIWFANGPWGKTSSASRAWIATPDECGWDGIACDTEGAVTELSLRELELTGTLTQNIGLLTALTAVTLNGNMLTGSLEATWGILTPLEPILKVFDLGSNELHGTLPETISGFTSLKVLSIMDNRVSGVLPQSLSTLTKLEVLNVALNTKLRGAIPTSLASLSDLTHLDLSSCNFDGRVPDIFDQVTNLKALGMGNEARPSVSQSILALAGLSQLTNLVVVGSKFVEAVLPSEIGDWWPGMASIRLKNVGLGGPLPSSIAQWTSLEFFEVSKNMLTGTVPEEVFPAWTSITSFSVRWNNMTGRIIENAILWTDLVHFDVRRNDFSGTIPTEIGALTKLDTFDLSENRFSGTIPSGVLLNFVVGAEVRLDMNDFTGVAPFCERDQTTKSTVDCDEVVCTCCNICL